MNHNAVLYNGYTGFTESLHLRVYYLPYMEGSEL